MTTKIIVSIIVVAALALTGAYAQERKPRTQEFHLKRAKRDKTVALVTGGVAVTSLVGALIYDQQGGEGIGEVLDNGLRATALYITSITTGLTSVGFAIGSGVHKRKAASIEPLAYSTFGNHRYGAISPTHANTRVVHAGVLIRF